MIKMMVATCKRSDSAVNNRTVEFVLSTSTPDRSADTIDAKGWRLENYKKNPVVLWGHDQSIPPIGKCSNLRVSKGALVGDVEFATAEQNPFAETIYRLVEGGFVNAGSVGFMPIKYTMNQETGGLDFKEQELFEYSIVGVPCNPEALSRAKEMDIDSEAIFRAFQAAAPMLPALKSAAEYRAELLAEAAHDIPKSNTVRRSRLVAVNRSTLNL